MVALDDMLGDHQSSYNSSWGEYESLNQISWQSFQSRDICRKATNVQLVVMLKAKW